MQEIFTLLTAELCINAESTEDKTGRERIVDCPIFDPKETTYEQWKKEIGVWRMVTTLPKRKHGSFVFLAMRGQAKDAVFQMKDDTLGQTNGFEEVLKVLDEIYMPEVFEKKYRNFNDLWKFFGKSNDPVIEWAVYWHAKILNYKMWHV